MKKQISIALIAIAAITLYFGFKIDTTISIGSGNRVHNMGLINKQQNTILFGCFLLVSGVILLGFSWKSNKPTEKSEGYRKCHNCAEIVKAEALICKSCQNPLPSIEEVKAQQKAMEEAEKSRIAELRHQLSTGVINEDNCPKGVCPCCKSIQLITRLSCTNCFSSFDEWSSWKLKPLNKQS